MWNSDKQVAVVTGSSSGFGLLAAIELARRGFHVIATMRDTSKGDELLQRAGELSSVQVEPLDVTCEISIRQFAALLQRIGKVDVLINNAGYALGGFAEEVSIREYREQFETNVFGVIAVTQAVLPFMRKQRRGKIINISSISGRTGFPGLSPYVSSKHALEGWSECLRLEVQPFGIEVALIEPGSYQTSIWTSGKQVAAASMHSASPYRDIMDTIEAHISRGQASFGDPREVAVKIADLAVSRHMKLRHPIGKGIQLLLAVKALLPWSLWERLILNRLK